MCKKKAVSESGTILLYDECHGCRELETLLAKTFEPTDLVVTLTYRDSNLPASKGQAEIRLKRFIRQLRASRRLRGHPTLYAYCPEGDDGGHRLHHHIVLNATEADYEEIYTLWVENGDYIDVARIADKGYHDWALYLSKPPRCDSSNASKMTWVSCTPWRADHVPEKSGVGFAGPPSKAVIL